MFVGQSETFAGGIDKFAPASPCALKVPPFRDAFPDQCVRAMNFGFPLSFSFALSRLEKRLHVVTVDFLDVNRRP